MNTNTNRGTKKNWVLRISTVALMLSLVTTTLVGGTFAKYVSTATAQDTARVAKFDVGYNTDEFDLFSTLYEDDFSGLEYDVWSNQGDKVVAPGTGGRFTLEMTNSSEVSTGYFVNLNVTNQAEIPIEYSIDGGDWNTELPSELSGKLLRDGQKEILIQWRWAFEDENDIAERDNSDTALGLAGTATITVDAAVTIQQIDTVMTLD